MSSSKVISVTITYEDGSSYEGKLPTSDTVYQGKHLLENGDWYEGEFFAGKYNGQGVYYGARYNETYTGTMVDGVKEGHGATQYGGGIRHEGEYKNGLRHGEGFTITRGGSVYTGMYKEDSPEGDGFMHFEEKDHLGRLSYEGKWLNGYMHGSGVLHMKDGTIIRGTFVTTGIASGDNFLVIYPSGGRYIGSLTAGERHGPGKMWEPNRDYFEGEWLDGVYSLGKLVKADGSVYQGQWVDGVYQENLGKCGGCQEILNEEASWTCSGCMKQGYCSATCQRKHWSKHKKECKMMGEEKAKEKEENEDEDEDEDSDDDLEDREDDSSTCAWLKSTRRAVKARLEVLRLQEEKEKKNPFDKEREPKRWKFFEDNKSNRHEDLDSWAKSLCRKSDCLGTPRGRWEGSRFCSEQCQTDSGY
jgi:hypothetical protein